MPSIHVGIITISDRVSQGQYEDAGGPALRAEAEARGWPVAAEAVIPDDRARIAETVRAFSARGCALILTTGGTGIAARDVTPEALRDVMRLEIPGFGEIMRSRSMMSTPNALVSRCMAALVDSSLVIALPGKPQGAVECLGFVAGAIDHTVKLAGGLPTSC
ncbi:MAG TPA: MogA/MoaB family molybdenum cofactor biosynthesis protein [Verrucomicrobiales bacterium]|nr:MogA/MoaB family molybdenum cofactor biosynthesis protein [Verrucomicrobiales bacterium]